MAANAAGNEIDNLQPKMSLTSVGLMLLAVVVGAVVAVAVLPAWLPALSGSLLGPQPKAYWYLSRASGLVSFVLLWFSTALGLLITNKLSRAWPGAVMAFDLHEYTSLLALALALFHGLILLGDGYIKYSLVQVLVPFAGTQYRPLWVGLGQVGFYLMALVTLTFYVRKSIGHRTWRLIHYLSFGMFLFALIHGVAAGTDAASPVVTTLYWTAGGSVLFLTAYRVLIARMPAAPSRKRSQA